MGPRDQLDLKGVSVLVVEDHDDSRDMLRQIVEAFGATVHEASNGYDGLMRFPAARPQLVLCDLMMPAMDGFEFMQRLRAIDRSVTAIAISVLDSDADFMRSWEAGFSGHLVKPVDFETVAAQLGRVFWAHVTRRAVRPKQGQRRSPRPN